MRLIYQRIVRHIRHSDRGPRVRLTNGRGGPLMRVGIGVTVVRATKPFTADVNVARLFGGHNTRT